MTPLVVIRPQPGCDATVRAARALGLEALAYPLFEVRPLEWEAPDPDTFDALLIGSANVLRHGGTGIARYRGMPAYAVGETTAAAVHQAGLELAGVGEGGLEALLGGLDPRHRRLLRLTARERVELTPPPGVSITECVTYASEPRAMPRELALLLTGGAAVLLHSGEAARHFAAECDRLGIARGAVAVAALAPRIAEAAGSGWADLAVAAEPRDKALLALAVHLCQGSGALES